MGKDVAAEFRSARKIFDVAAEAIGIDIAALCFSGPEASLTKTANAQPAILTTALAYLAAALESGSLKERPAFVAGHSLGQYTALTAAGSLSIRDAVAIVRERGRLMARAGTERPGTMAAVLGLDEETVRRICAESGAEPANYNGPTQIVVGGTVDAVEAASAMAREQGGKVLPVKVAGAFHTSLMATAATEFSVRLEATPFSDAKIAVVSNVTGTPLTAAADIVDDLASQVTQPVQWNRSMECVLDQGVDTFIEIGPGRTLSGMLKRIAPSVRMANIDSIETLTAVSGV
jgi:[acyl-carrier-protein] S-malonyltransferase